MKFVPETNVLLNGRSFHAKVGGKFIDQEIMGDCDTDLGGGWSQSGEMSAHTWLQ